MGIMMKFIGISKKNNAQKRKHNLLKPTVKAVHISTRRTGLSPGLWKCVL